MIGALLVRLESDPFIPDGDEAREWAETELSNPRYADAKPTWFDRAAQEVADFIGRIFSPDAGESVGNIALVVIVILLLAALITVLIVWGRPRRSERVRRRGMDLLGERDDRTAVQLRAEAERSARNGDWDTATVLRYRAIARGLLERDIIEPAPGSTAQAIARDAARIFPAESTALREAAGLFDDVRYLRHPATEESYAVVTATDARVSALHPEPVPA
jgi:hypothetical protein